MPIKILHTADLHLDSPLSSLTLRNEDLQARVITASRKSLEKMVDFCVAEGVVALLIAGDLYDRVERSAKTAAYLTIQMERLRTANVQVFYIKGNHDAENPITGEIDLPADLPPGRPSFMTRVWLVDSRRFRVGQARRVRCCRVAQAPGVLGPGFGSPAMNAA